MISIKSPDATLKFSQNISDISANYYNLRSFEFVENVQYNITVSQDVSTVEWMIDSVSVRGFIQEVLLVRGNNSSCEARLLGGVRVVSCSQREGLAICELVWGYAPPGNVLNLGPLKLLLAPKGL